MLQVSKPAPSQLLYQFSLRVEAPPTSTNLTPRGGATGERSINSGLRFDVMNILIAHGGLFVGQKAAAAAGAHM